MLNFPHVIRNTDRYEVVDSLEFVRSQIMSLEDERDKYLEDFRKLKRYGICSTR